jgi:glycosyltransferase involved in cell wall biosynthesis
MHASVIIPTFQREEFLVETMASVRNQDYPKDAYEIIIVNNCPLDSAELSGLVNLHQAPAVRYLHEPRNGLHHARHAGARAAQGDILVYVDDDVLCPAGWLKAMLEPYHSPQVAMVAGKVELAYEVEPPSWLHQFRGILSALDRGKFPHPLPLLTTPVGCNMSVRKSVLFEVGGFNPDGFGNRHLLPFRGDGECGLARKVQEAGWLIWYEPRAWLWHRVPASRMTREYIWRRSALAGIESAYTDLRYQRRSLLQLLYCSLGCLSKSLYHRISMTTSQPQKQMHHLFLASVQFHRAMQHWRQAKSKYLRDHTRQKSYLQ